MKESPFMIKSKAFALDVIRVCKELSAVESESWIELLIEADIIAMNRYLINVQK